MPALTGDYRLVIKQIHPMIRCACSDISEYHAGYSRRFAAILRGFCLFINKKKQKNGAEEAVL